MQGHELECFGHSPGKGKWELNLTKHSENGRNKIKKEITKKKKKNPQRIFLLPVYNWCIASINLKFRVYWLDLHTSWSD